MKKIICLLALLLALVNLVGCMQSSVTASNSETLANPFSTTPSASTQTQPSSGNTEQVKGPGDYSFAGKVTLLQDEKGNYIAYDGGEMHFPFELSGQNFDQYGIGFLLFLDGIPQPYKTSQTEEYSYMHVLTIPDNQTTVSDEFIFAPTVGQKGDCLEFYIAQVVFPWYYKTASKSLQWSECMAAAGGRMLLNEDPPAAQLPELNDRVLSYSVSYQDLTAAEIAGWSSEDLQEKIESNFYVNEIRDFGIKHGVTADDTVCLRFEIYGCSSAQYGIVFFVDNQPLYIDPQRLHISTQYGQKTIIEVELDMSDFDGRSLIYALRVPRNYHSLLPKEGSRSFVSSGSILLLGEGK